jgi:hypothetical protein
MKGTSEDLPGSSPYFGAALFGAMAVSVALGSGAEALLGYAKDAEDTLFAAGGLAVISLGALARRLFNRH